MLHLINKTSKNQITPVFCHNPFVEWCSLNVKSTMLYNKLGCPEPFDVTLRDGLQSLSKEEQKIYTLEKKKEIYEKINLTYQPKNIEIGSIVSSRVLPMFSNTLELFSFVEKNKNKKKYNPTNFILIPTAEKLLEVIDVPNLNNFSFITSVSESFQKKKYKKKFK